MTNKYILGTYTYVDVGGDAAFCVPTWTEQCKTGQPRQIPPVSLLLFSHEIIIVIILSVVTGVEEYLRGKKSHSLILVPW